QLVLVAALEFGVGVQPLTFEQRVAVLQVEQGTRGNRDDQRIGLAVWHGAILPGRGRMECDDAKSGEQLQPEVNCSASIRSSRLCSGSNSNVTVRSCDSRIMTSTTSRTSCESAVALTGRL